MLGLAAVGLRRAGFGQAQRSAIKKAYRVLLQSGLKLSDALAQVKAAADSDEVQQIVAELDFWGAVTTASAEQVRQPIYKGAVGFWKNSGMRSITARLKSGLSASLGLTATQQKWRMPYSAALVGSNSLIWRK